MFKNLYKVFKNNYGFTLIELVVVIAVITIIGYISFPYISNLSNETQENINIINSKTYGFKHFTERELQFDSYCPIPYDITDVEGSGTSNDPYKICNLEGLNLIRDDLTAHYILTADIDATNTRTLSNGWNPIGDLDEISWSFTGVLDGQGHIIDNLYMDYVGKYSYGVGFFSAIQGGGIVKNLGFTNLEIRAEDTSGLFAFVFNGIIENVFAVGTMYNSSADSTLDSIGGLIGDAEDVIVRNSYVDVDISAPNYTNSKLGGLIGWQRSSTGSTSIFENNYVLGKINASTGGGLMGKDQSSSLINNSFWNTDTTGKLTSDGGIGFNTEEMQEKNIYTSWDFEDTWSIDSDINGGYPFLQVFHNDNVNSQMHDEWTLIEHEQIEDFSDSNINSFFSLTGDWDHNTDEGWIESSNVNLNNSSSNSHLTFTIPACAVDIIISIDYKVDSEKNYDYLRVYLNSSMWLPSESGQINWTTTTEDITEIGNFDKTYTINVKYNKDDSGSSGADKAYIDNIKVSYVEKVYN
ncbi:MAG: prepilin-type N-terminal cleavage/methylation domain-containing protein [bacterium]